MDSRFRGNDGMGAAACIEIVTKLFAAGPGFVVRGRLSLPEYNPD